MVAFDPHEIIPPAYRGREQAYIKHCLLEGYLERLLYIVGWNAQQLRYKEIIFVDCFAGPWQDNSDDLSSTSISISLRLLSNVQKTLASKGKLVKFRAVYVEFDSIAFSRLQSFLATSTPENIRSEAIHGDFVKNIPKILEKCPNDSFAFFFIDPKGWLTVQPNILQDLLKRPNSEFLINFMFDFVNRTLSMTGSREKIAGLFNNTINFDEIPIDPEQRQNYVLQKYRKAIIEKANAIKNRTFSAYVTILDPLKNRTKYHLLYLTRHPLGIIEFMTQSEKMANIQMNVRIAAKLDKKTQNTNIDDLFGVDTDQNFETKNTNISKIEQYWLTLIGDKSIKVNMEVFANALCETNAFPSELQTAIKNLFDTNQIINLDADSSRRRKIFINYEKNERLKCI